MHTWTKVPSTQLIWVQPTNPGYRVLNRQSYHQWWLIEATLIVEDPGVSPGIIRYSFTERGRMGGWVGLAARGDREICWYSLHGESKLDRSHCSTIVYPLSVLGPLLIVNGITRITRKTNLSKYWKTYHWKTFYSSLACAVIQVTQVISNKLNR